MATIRSQCTLRSYPKLESATILTSFLDAVATHPSPGINEEISEFVTVASNRHYFEQCQLKRRCPSCDHGYQKCFEFEWNTGNKGRLFFTCSNDCGYFDWVKDEDLGGESSSIWHAVNQALDKEEKELPRLFDGLVRISEKQDVDISLHMTFLAKERELPTMMGKERGRIEGVI
ncbi:Hypothetical predicted protein [Olea europaea subsp. europaea]|uniref:Uncharacterized protein n=1 Tax=Olea europaea subsp. europaea TaxID=158383 RepID=A0A8S0R229_OLEEU|nr:Hypothetical predicted protein [Olea europaea subsp. europaea]